MDTKSPPTLGPLLRSWRERKNWTLKEMSDRTAIPVSTLSKVERDRASLTYDKLLQVSQGLQISLPELFADSCNAVDGEPTVTARRSIGRLADAMRVNTEHYD